jgi:adenylate kinase family enzyme
MNIDEAFKYVEREKPQIIHLSGKTSTGKSTFARELHDRLGYRIVELDQIVRDSVIAPLGLENRGDAFIEVYKERSKSEWIQRFIIATRNEIVDDIAGNRPVILDGAIANATTLQELMQGLPDAIIFYLNPINLDTYVRNLSSRFAKATPQNNAGLPESFWNLIDKAEFAAFCQTHVISLGIREGIEAYALRSQKQSVQRLLELREYFTGIIVIDV